jgi:hypothetical protein
MVTQLREILTTMSARLIERLDHLGTCGTEPDATVLFPTRLRRSNSNRIGIFCRHDPAEEDQRWEE